MTEPAAAGGQWDRIAGASQTLVRSRLEIARILNGIAGKRTPLTAYFAAADLLFMSCLRQIDADAGFLVVDYGSDKAANVAVLTAPSVLLSSNNAGAGIEFIGADPAETLIDQVPGIRFAFPDVLIVQQRRAHRRIRTLPGVPLRCIADTHGAISFEAEIIDISVGGFGAMIYGDDIRLNAGTVLHGCKIIHPGGAVVDLDIEILYSAAAALADGSPARRSGCRFIGVPAQLDDLIRVFVLDLEKDGSQSGG